MKLLSVVVLLIAVTSMTSIAASHIVPWRCRSDDDDFIRKNAPLLESLTTDPMNIVWLNNVTNINNNVTNISYQRQWYDELKCRFVFEQLHNRGPGVWAYAKIFATIRHENTPIVEFESHYNVEAQELLYDQQAALELQSSADPFYHILDVYGYQKPKAVAISSLPTDVQCAFEAIHNDTLVTINDPLADLHGVVYPIRAYVHP